MTLVPKKLEAVFSSKLRDRLIELRRELHRHPELSFQEQHTADRLTQELERLDPVNIERVAGTGIVARLRGKDSGAPLVAVRGDIDALPIQELRMLAKMQSGMRESLRRAALRVYLKRSP